MIKAYFVLVVDVEVDDLIEMLNGDEIDLSLFSDGNDTPLLDEIEYEQIGGP